MVDPIENFSVRAPLPMSLVLESGNCGSSLLFVPELLEIQENAFYFGSNSKDEFSSLELFFLNKRLKKSVFYQFHFRSTNSTTQKMVHRFFSLN
jgi:hypothetical protein